MIRKIAFLAGALYLSITTCVWADDGVPRGAMIDLGRGKRVFVGMNYAEVLGVLGAPKDKLELETKREDVWSYENAKLIFRGGLLESATRFGREYEEQIEAGQRDTELQTQRRNEEPIDDVEVEEILSEIMDGSSSDNSREDRRRKRYKRR